MIEGTQFYGISHYLTRGLPYEVSLAAVIVSLFFLWRHKHARYILAAFLVLGVSMFPYTGWIVGMLMFGLGAPPIILDTSFKVFRGGSTVFGAVCDILVPRQTSALAERDGPTLVRATLLAAALCSLPAAGVSLILLIGADRLFAILLGNAATMPAAVTPILIVLLFADLTKMVTHSVLVHSGFFRDVARIGMGVAAAMAALGAFAIATHLDLVHFLEAYAAIYVCAAIAAAVMMIRGPFRLAHQSATIAQPAIR